jgi:predicted metallopeptidase
MATIYADFVALKKVVELLKQKFPRELEHIKPDRIYYQTFSKKKSKVLGKIGRIPSRFINALSDYDYFLEIYKEHWIESTEAKRLYVVLHELLHVPEGGFNPDDKEYRKVKEHDVQDFSQLLKVYGISQENVEKLEQKVKQA